MQAFTDEFDDDDLIYFTQDTGMTVNLSQNRVLFFRKTMAGWIARSFPLSSVRTFSEIVATPGQYVGSTQRGGAAAIGEGIGAVLQSSYEKSKAKSNTGIEISIRSTELPKFFLNVAEREERNALLEACTQAFVEQNMPDPYGEVPESIALECQRPSEEAQAKAAQEQNQSHAQQNLDAQEFLQQQEALQAAPNDPTRSRTIYLSILVAVFVFVALAIIF